jgi:hypothetical protein
MLQEFELETQTMTARQAEIGGINLDDRCAPDVRPDERCGALNGGGSGVVSVSVSVTSSIIVTAKTEWPVEAIPSRAARARMTR